MISLTLTVDIPAAEQAPEFMQRLASAFEVLRGVISPVPAAAPLPAPTVPAEASVPAVPAAEPAKRGRKPKADQPAEDKAPEAAEELAAPAPEVKPAEPPKAAEQPKAAEAAAPSDAELLVKLRAAAAAVIKKHGAGKVTEILSTFRHADNPDKVATRYDVISTADKAECLEKLLKAAE